VAVRVTAVPAGNVAEQVVGQSMPAGLEMIRPAPFRVTVSVQGGGVVLKVAVTDCAADIVTVQVGTDPVQAPPQPTKEEPDAGVAVRVTSVPLLKLAEQAVPQLTPAGVELTVPLPVPAGVTARA
jgi:hypothetical protein